MAGQILTLPIRLSARAASVALRTGEEIASRSIALATQAIHLVRPAESPVPEPESRPAGPPRPRPRPPEPPRAPAPEAAPPPRTVDQQTEPPEVVDYDEPPVPAPQHVSEETELAAEVAEPGAEDGAGAEIHVDEPWSGYGQLAADDVVERIEVADVAELAAIQLFESTHRKRTMVLTAVEDQLERISRQTD